MSGQIDHGGRLAAARTAFPHAPVPWIDLSTGINPWPYPVGAIAAEDWARLPDPDAVAALETAMADCWGVDPTRVVAVPGSEVALRLLAVVRGGPARVGIASPTYGSHADGWAGHEVVEASLEALIAGVDRLDVLVVVRPNNPDGRIADEAMLADAAARLAARRGWLVIDEAFADAMPDASLADRPWAGEALILKSFGKFFGLAGLRLGALVAPPAIAGRLRALLGDWRVSGPAVAIGRRAYADRAWQVATRDRLAVASARLEALIARQGLGIACGNPLFHLVSNARCTALHAHLAARGILARAFAYNPDWLRLGLPGDEAAWSRLSAALEEFAA